jgi:glycosyltransferase involved in cell wall biosynthesis
LTITVVTIVKNHSIGLQKTFASLVNQSIRNWELIIVLGASIDSSEEVCTRLAKSDQRVKVLIQKDSGIYQAMNLGLSQAKGEFVWFMNSGDVFANDQVLEQSLKVHSTKTYAIVIGAHSIATQKNSKPYVYSSKALSAIEFSYNRRSGCHQAMIFNTENLKSIGGFDVAYSLASDFNSVLKLMGLYKVFRVDKHFAIVEPGGVTDLNILEVYRQKGEIRDKYFANRFNKCMSFLWTFLAISKLRLKSWASNRQ